MFVCPRFESREREREREREKKTKRVCFLQTLSGVVCASFGTSSSSSLSFFFATEKRKDTLKFI